MAAGANDSAADKQLGESLRRFCRSIELCDNYLRGYYGLKVVSRCAYVRPTFTDKSQTSTRLLKSMSQINGKVKSNSGLPLPDIKSVERLNEVATAKLSEIVRRSSGGESGWQGYDKAELIAAKELLNRDAGPSITR